MFIRHQQEAGKVQGGSICGRREKPGVEGEDCQGQGTKSDTSGVGEGTR